MLHKLIRSIFTRVCASRFCLGSTSKRVICAFFAATLFSVCQAVAQDNAGQIENLVQQLKSQEAEVRRSAADALGDIGAEARQAVPDLVTALKDPEAMIRTTTAYALGKMGTEAKQAVPDLIAALKDSDAMVRISAADALGTIGEEAVPDLLLTLKDSDSDVRRYAETALESIRSKTENGFPTAE
jgi:HEAT repeat protein